MHSPLITAGLKILNERTVPCSRYCSADPDKAVRFIGNSYWMRDENKQKD